MDRISFGDSEFSFSKFIYGTAKLHRIASAKERRRLLCAAVYNGFTHFDTSPFYGDGIAEKELGRLAKLHPNITITTKYGLYSPGRLNKPNWEIYARKVGGKLIPSLSKPRRNFDVRMATRSLHASLKRISRDYVDIFMLHEPLDLAPNFSEILEFLKSMKSKGLIRKYGVSGTILSIENIYHELPHLIEIAQIQDEFNYSIEYLERYSIDNILVTYGYNKGPFTSTTDYLNQIRYALSRNKRGAIVVSTNRIERLPQYEKLLQEH
jgi:D-threo-aldose 1-dehydrogenase